MINQYRIFYDRADGMEAWLGRMARSGKRLISVQGSAFSFENCPKGAYEYRVRFVAVSQHAVRKKQMEERGYRTFWLPIGRNAKDGPAKQAECVYSACLFYHRRAVNSIFNFHFRPNYEKNFFRSLFFGGRGRSYLTRMISSPIFAMHSHGTT